MSGYLKDKIVYLCGPIGLSNDDGVEWRNNITPRLLKLGLKVDDPTKSTINGRGEIGNDKTYWKTLIKEQNFSQLKKEFWPIVHKDLRSVDKCDFLIVNYDALTPTVGTYDEITRAKISRKPILLKYNEEQLDYFNPWVVTWVKENELFSEWENLLKYLENEIDNGYYNSSTWTL